MLAIKIEDLKDFTSKLLLQPVFDEFSVAQAEIVTGTTIIIDGHINAAFYDTDECVYSDGSPRNFAYWSELRETCLQRIRGKKLPLSFLISLMLTPAQQREIFSEDADSDLFAAVENFYFNLRYDSNGLIGMTGASYRTFTMNKLAEQSFERYITDFLQTNDIAFLIL